ncbi:MAG: hypothetical protein K8S25_04900 [Alphaproteobacteria bacterium]|nr:hypothetical protein [Alphaproteobacteria bacterium]
MRTSALAPVIALCAALSALSPAAAAPKESWRVAKASGGALAYNTATLARDVKTGFITLASALFVSQAQKDADGKPFQYVISEDRLNCTNHTFQAVTRVLLDGNQNVVDQQELDAQPWQPIKDNGVLAFLESVACNGDAVSNAREAASIEDMLNLMTAMAK